MERGSSMKIERVNDYYHPNFSQEILKQHHAFLVDGVPCSFNQVDATTAVLLQPELACEPLFEEFHFYSEHILAILDTKGVVLKSYPSYVRTKVFIDDLMPSQWILPQSRYHACESFVFDGDDLILPVTKDALTGRYVVLDGHARLKVAYDRGMKEVYVFETRCSSFIYKFVDEARKRKILHVQDMKVIDDDTYQKEWNTFCDQLFSGFAF